MLERRQVARQDLRALIVLSNPTVNSYQRLVPSYDAPVILLVF